MMFRAAWRCYEWDFSGNADRLIYNIQCFSSGSPGLWRQHSRLVTSMTSVLRTILNRHYPIGCRGGDFLEPHNGTAAEAAARSRSEVRIGAGGGDVKRSLMVWCETDASQAAQVSRPIGPIYNRKPEVLVKVNLYLQKSIDCVNGVALRDAWGLTDLSWFCAPHLHTKYMTIWEWRYVPIQILWYYDCQCRKLHRYVSS